MNKFKYTIIFIIILSAFVFGINVSAQPGTEQDPLVSRSYLNNRIAVLEAQISNLTAALEVGMFAEAPAGANNASDTVHEIDPVTVYDFAPVYVPTPIVHRDIFVVVRAEAGTTMIGGASTEIILRAGEAIVVAGYNGLANVTLGHDIMNGQRVELNHLLIVPQNDGRGLHFLSSAYLMVKGDFQILNQ